MHTNYVDDLIQDWGNLDIFWLGGSYIVWEEVSRRTEELVIEHDIHMLPSDYYLAVVRFLKIKRVP